MTAGPDATPRSCCPTAWCTAAVVVQDGLITDDQPAAHRPPRTDLDGDYLIPGAVDLHTDNLERQVEPRQNARWPSRAALLAHDAQCAAAGITTVFDALCVGHAGFDDDRPRTCARRRGRSGRAGAHRPAESRALPASALRAAGARMWPSWRAAWTHPMLRMVSLMDHTPGTGQFGDLARYRPDAARGGDDADAGGRPHRRPAGAARTLARRQTGRSRGPSARQAACAGQPRRRDGGRDRREPGGRHRISEFPVAAEAARPRAPAGWG